MDGILPNELALSVAEYTSSTDYVNLRSTCSRLNELLIGKQWSHIVITDDRERERYPEQDHRYMMINCSDLSRASENIKKYTRSISIWTSSKRYREIIPHIPERVDIVKIVGSLNEPLVEFIQTIDRQVNRFKLDVEFFDMLPPQHIYGGIETLLITTSIPFEDWGSCLLKSVNPTTLKITDFSCQKIPAEELQHAFISFDRLQNLQISSMIDNPNCIQWLPQTVQTLSIHPTHHNKRASSSPPAPFKPGNVKTLILNKALNTGYSEPAGLYEAYNYFENNPITHLKLSDTTPETLSLVENKMSTLESLEFIPTPELNLNKILSNNPDLKELIIHQENTDKKIHIQEKLNCYYYTHYHHHYFKDITSSKNCSKPTVTYPSRSVSYRLNESVIRFKLIHD